MADKVNKLAYIPDNIKTVQELIKIMNQVISKINDNYDIINKG